MMKQNTYISPASKDRRELRWDTRVKCIQNGHTSMYMSHDTALFKYHTTKK